MSKWIRVSAIILLAVGLSACAQASREVTPDSSSLPRNSSASSSSSTNSSSDRTEPNSPMDEATANRLLIQEADTTTDTVTTPIPAKGRKKMLSVTPQLQRVWNYCPRPLLA